MSELPQPEADHVLDAKGLFCPEPVMLLHNTIRDAKAGEVIKVLATDPSTKRDVTRFCIHLGHELITQSEAAGSYCYWIRKA